MLCTVSIDRLTAELESHGRTIESRTAFTLTSPASLIVVRTLIYNSGYYTTPTVVVYTKETGTLQLESTASSQTSRAHVRRDGSDAL
mmetsp:Transcript_12665/g.46278  ORF Transcript_12665/g.46278 Transcript_12665/m.46278 type:complete len:87 (+) Transcript_12665:933-1193(+)